MRRWRSILVVPFAAESVPKNTRKGKSMKLLVPAVYAQLRVGAGRIGLWAGRNGIRQSTHLPLEAFFCGYPYQYEICTD